MSPDGVGAGHPAQSRPTFQKNVGAFGRTSPQKTFTVLLSRRAWATALAQNPAAPMFLPLSA